MLARSRIRLSTQALRVHPAAYAARVGGFLHRTLLGRTTALEPPRRGA